MPLPTLGPTISATGISAPTYDAILQSLVESVQAIYGSDVYIAPDSQDGQMLAIFAAAINDQNQKIIACYNSFAPQFALGNGLSNLVQINGLERQTASNSTAVGDVVGVAGTVITAGVVADNNGNKWNLPATVVIPDAGTISVTVTAQDVGAIAASAGTINKIQTPTSGWQSFLSSSDAVVGQPVETDAALRKRQAVSTSLPANSPLGGVLSAILALPGVLSARAYENATNSADANGIPARSICLVVEGGDVGQIAQAIGQKKTPGAATYGSTAQDYIDPITDIEYTINFFVLAFQALSVEISLTAVSGYNSNVAAEIQQSVADYINGLGIGQPVQISRVWAPAYLNGAADGLSYEITSLTLDAGGVDVVIPFNKAASIDPTNVVITVNP